MIRPNFRRSLRFDNLESRELLSGSVPSAEQQYMLEMINSARTNPAATADWLKNNITPDVKSTLDYYHVDLNSTLKTIANTPAKPPVAWNSNLASAAQAHSQDMANTKVQSHSGSDGSTSDSRITRSGYGDTSSTGENAYAYASDVKQAMEAFLLDWGVADQGHRRNLLQANVGTDKSFKDVGIGIVHTNDSSFGPVVVTQDFARPASNAQATLLGVAYSDDQNPGRYDMGEGRGGVRVDATNIDNGAGYNTQTSDAGGYQMSLPAGRYQVTASVNDKVVQTQQVNIGTDNVKFDIVLNKSWDGRSRMDVINAVTPARSTTNVTAAKTVTATKATVTAPAPVSVAAAAPVSAPVVSIPMAAASPAKISTKVSTVAPTSFGAWSSWKANTA